MRRKAETIPHFVFTHIKDKTENSDWVLYYQALVDMNIYEGGAARYCSKIRPN